ncbi:uncharacterized protein C2orf50 homolog [Apus apus]|uniref:uncharacterized protein C2orf50 homolog n=1 Tax=Apus apus TaxID=8895 RepID=UPI0021F88C9A|nr:uncharacterized protein C2orf50 homolog [Apus apus]
MPNNTGDRMSHKMDTLGRSSGFRRKTWTRSGQQETTALGQPSPAPSQPRRAVTAGPAAGAWAGEQAALQEDQVQLDKIWRESVEAEQRGRKIWYQNWSFLKDYDQMGVKKEQKPLPSYVPVFSSKLPNSSSQAVGSRLGTELGRALVSMEWGSSSAARRRRLEEELQPS